MSSSITRRPLLGLLAVLTGLTVIADEPQAANAVRFELEWEQPGPEPAYFEVCVDGTCLWLDARPTQGSTWRAPLPALALGEHQLVLRACGAGTCVPGTPDLFVRVVRPNPKTPPILVR